MYCLETLRVVSEKFFYPTKNKYTCLANSKLGWKIKLDDKANECLNLYFDYEVEKCLSSYEEGKELKFNDNLSAYGAIAQPKLPQNAVNDGNRRLLESSEFTSQEY